MLKAGRLISLIVMVSMLAACGFAATTRDDVSALTQPSPRALPTESPTPRGILPPPTATEADGPTQPAELAPHLLVASRELRSLTLLQLQSGESISYPTIQWELGGSIDLRAAVSNQGLVALRTDHGLIQLYQPAALEPIDSIELLTPAFFPPPGEDPSPEFQQKTYALRQNESQPHWSPEGSRLAFAAAIDDGLVNPYLYHLQDGQIIRPAELPGGSLPLDWSPDGRTLVAVSGQDFTPYGYAPASLHAVQVDTGLVQSVSLPAAMYPISVVGWVGQGQVIIAGRRSAGHLQNLSLVDFEAASLESSLEGVFSGAAIAPEAELLLVAGRSQGVELFDFGSGQFEPIAELALGDSLGGAAYYPSLEAFAVERLSGTMLISHSGAISTVFEDARGLPYPSPNGELLAFGPSQVLYDGDLLVFSPDGQTVFESDRKATDLVWWPDSSGLAFAQIVGPVGVLDVESRSVSQPWLDRGERIALFPAEGSLDLPAFEAGEEEAAGAISTSEPARVVRPLRSGTQLFITELQMLTAEQGWGLGYAEGDLLERVLYTRDGGENWREVTPPKAAPPSSEELQASASGPRQIARLHALDEARAWVSYANPQDLSRVVVWRTEDGGSSWQASRPIDVAKVADYGPWVSGFHPLGFEFVNEEIGWLYAMTEVPASMMAGDSLLLRTEDGGATWEFVDLTATFGFQGMHFFDSMNGYRLEASRVGDFSSTLRTRDGGEYWFQDPNVPAGREPSLFNPQPSDCLAAYQLEELPDQAIKMVVLCRVIDAQMGEQLQNRLFTSRDEGRNWQSSVLPVAGHPDSSFTTDFVDDQVGWLLDYESGALHRTVNGGDSWDQVNTVAWMGELHFLDPLNGWAVAWEPGMNIFDREHALVRTVDSGYSWELIRPVLE